MLDILPPASRGRWHSKRWRRQIGLVRVEVVEKRKKRALSLAREPMQEGAVDIGGGLAAKNLVAVYQPTKPVGIGHRTDERRAEDELGQRYWVIFVVAKATIEAHFIAAIDQIGDKPI